MTRMHPSPDLVSLAMRQAKAATGADEGECQGMLAVVRGEMAKSVWPEGFF